MATRAELEAMIAREATAAGMNPQDFIRMAQIESSFNPNAGAKTSSAKGLFQFIDSTAKNYGLKNVYDPVESTRAAIRLAKDNIKATGAKDGAEMYMAHQWGSGGFNKMKNANPNASVESVLGASAAKNNAMAGMTVAQGLDYWRNKFNGTSTGNYSQDAQQDLVQPTADTLYKTEALPQQTQNVPQQRVDVPAPIQIATSAIVDTTPTVNNKKQYAAQLAAAFGEPPDMSEQFPDELDSLIRSVFEQA
jgi:hypothetical protein